MNFIDRLLAQGTWFFWLSLSDKGGRRSGIDRRVFACSNIFQRDAQERTAESELIEDDHNGRWNMI